MQYNTSTGATWARSIPDRIYSQEEPMAETVAAGAPAANDVIQLVIQFNDALNAEDLDTMMRLMTGDCVFENTSPAPDGERYAGQESVRAFWRDFFIASVRPRIEIEEIYAAGDRCVMRWTYRWLDAQGNPGHVRGVDLYRVENGRIAEKLSYVKG